MIQDKIMAACLAAFATGLVFQIVPDFRRKVCGVSWKTSLVTGVSCCVWGVCLLTLRLWFAGAMDLALGCLWFVVLGQWLAYRPRPAKCGNCRHYWLVNEQCKITRKAQWREYVCGRFKERKGEKV